MEFYFFLTRTDDPWRYVRVIMNKCTEWILISQIFIFNVYLIINRHTRMCRTVLYHTGDEYFPLFSRFYLFVWVNKILC